MALWVTQCCPLQAEAASGQAAGVCARALPWLAWAGRLHERARHSRRPDSDCPPLAEGDFCAGGECQIQERPPVNVSSSGHVAFRPLGRGLVSSCRQQPQPTATTSAAGPPIGRRRRPHPAIRIGTQPGADRSRLACCAAVYVQQAGAPKLG